MPSTSTIFFSLIGGIVPAIIWLFFWLQEDKKKPEPRGLIIATFFAGMLAVPLVIPFQRLIYTYAGNSIELLFLGWATVEELMKAGVAYMVSLRKKEMNEPIDALIYLMTAALGFAALENAIYIVNPLSLGNITDTLLTSNFRFIGASLLHTLASAIIGISIAFSFYKEKKTKRVFIFWGVSLSIALHTLFNLFIIKGQSGTTFATFGFIWIAIVVLLLFFEKIKQLYPVNKL